MKTFFGVLGTAVAVGLFILIGFLTGLFNSPYAMPVGICLIGLLSAGVLVILTTAQRDEYGAEFDISMVVSIGIAVLAVVGLLITGIIVVVNDCEWYVGNFMLAAVIYLAGIICLLIAKSQDYPEFLTFVSCGVKIAALIYAIVVGIILFIDYGIVWYGICYVLGGLIVIAGAIIQIIGTANYDGRMLMLSTMLSAVGLALAVIIGSIQGFNEWEGWMTILSSLGAGALFVFDIVLQVNNSDYVVVGARNN